MLKAIPAPRAELSKYAPKMLTIKIHPDKIREVIGSGGKVIQKISAECGVKIDIEDDGSVFVSSVDIEGQNGPSRSSRPSPWTLRWAPSTRAVSPA